MALCAGGLIYRCGSSAPDSALLPSCYRSVAETASIIDKRIKKSIIVVLGKAGHTIACESCGLIHLFDSRHITPPQTPAIRTTGFAGGFFVVFIQLTLSVTHQDGLIQLRRQWQTPPLQQRFAVSKTLHENDGRPDKTILPPVVIDYFVSRLWRLSLSAIMAINSEFVGFPLILDTVYPKNL